MFRRSKPAARSVMNRRAGTGRVLSPAQRVCPVAAWISLEGDRKVVLKVGLRLDRVKQGGADRLTGAPPHPNYTRIG